MQRRYRKRKNEKRRKKAFAWVLAFSLILGSAASQEFVSYATAETTQATENSTEESSENTETETTDNGVTDASLSKAQQDAKEAERNKRAAQEILDNLKATKENIEDYIIELDKNVNELQIEISHLQQSQKELQETIEETEKQLESARGAWSKQYAEMKERIQMVYESGNKRYLDVLLTATSMTDMLNKTEYVSQVSAYDYGVLTELKQAKEEVANLKQKLDKDLATNEAMQKQVNDQKETMEALVAQKSQQVAEYEASIAGQEEEVARYARAQAQAEAIIVAAEQNASSSATSTYTGGIFTWPAPGNYGITSYFGGRESPTAGASTYHRGIDIACNTGDPIVAAYNYAEGNYVCIDHGGGIVTVYMHNSQLNVSVGETVTAGQTIAAAGSTGYSTGPHCHFGVRVDGTYVDPLGYLQ